MYYILSFLFRRAYNNTWYISRVKKSDRDSQNLGRVRSTSRISQLERNDRTFFIEVFFFYFPLPHVRRFVPGKNNRSGPGELAIRYSQCAQWHAKRTSLRSFRRRVHILTISVHDIIPWADAPKHV